MPIYKNKIDIELPGITVWLVDGGMVRNNTNIDFTLGGHGYVYSFIPKDEIWIDDDTAEDEMIYVLIHEMHERALMKDGISYDDAHNQASNYEMLARQNPEKIEELLGTAERENTASFEKEAKKETVLVLDIDGTLADVSHREYLVDRPDPDWDAFLEPELVAKDSPYPEAQKALPQLMEEASDVYFVSGRNENLRKITTRWLNKYYGINVPKDHLFLRKNGDHTPPIDFKRSVVEEILGKDQDYLFIDDDQDNLEMFADYGETMQAPACWKKIARIAMRVTADAFAGPYNTGDIPGGKQNMACPICGWESDEFAQNASKRCTKCGADLSSVPSASFSINNAPNEEFAAKKAQLDTIKLEDLLKSMQIAPEKIKNIKQDIEQAKNPGTQPPAPQKPNSPENPQAPQSTYPGQNEPYKGLRAQMGQTFGEPTPTRSIYDEPPALAEVAEEDGHYTIQEITDAFAEQLGRQIGIDWNSVDFEPADLQKGLLVELEHGSGDEETNVTMDDPESVAKIAWAHLKERADYYDQLENIENSSQKNYLDE